MEPEAEPSLKIAYPALYCAGQPVFFEAERRRFFRLLNSVRPELVAACLRALFDRLDGLTADYAHNLTREPLRQLLLFVIQEYLSFAADEGGDDELSVAGTDVPHVLVSMVIRVPLSDG